MGRMRSILSTFCIHRKRNHLSNGSAFSQTSNDVSHLATPHISPPSLNLHQHSPNLRRSVNSTPNDETNNANSDQNQLYLPLHRHSNVQEELNSRSNSARGSPVINAPHCPPPDNQSQPSPPSSASPQSNNVDQHHQASIGSPLEPQVPQASNNNNQIVQRQQNNQQQASQPQQQIQPRSAVVRQVNNGSSQTREKLSYDIISVREPLAKVLAERQQIQQAQLVQRQVIGDHEYIEVYGERGSSCFYEEIAGSNASSVTYDQIGTNSNHNYQVLISNYASGNRLPSQDANQVSSNDGSHYNHISSNSRDGMGDENIYDITDSRPQPRQSNNETELSQPVASTSSFIPPSIAESLTDPLQSSNALIHYASIVDNGGAGQSVPIYSVINKANRKSIIGDCSRPPKPPPKNVLMIMKQVSSSAIQFNQADQACSRTGQLTQNPTPSSFLADDNGNKPSDSSNFNEIDELRSNTPQPPPRLSKQTMFNATNRPLPLPDTYDLNDNMRGLPDKNKFTDEEDNDCASNGYELLEQNWDDDAMDVGYEKIRESNRYSGGSLSSQIRNIPLNENGGYESVQPIYSSPSNELAEPNYEAISPATAQIKSSWSDPNSKQ